MLNPTGLAYVVYGTPNTLKPPYEKRAISFCIQYSKYNKPTAEEQSRSEEITETTSEIILQYEFC
jgi:hypothetical protein